MRLIAVIPEMIDGQRRRPDAPLAGGDDPFQVRQDRFVNGALETNSRVAPEEPVLRIRGEPGARIETHCAGAKSRLGERRFNRPAVAGADPFVGVDVKDPVAGRVLDRVVSRRGKIVSPLVLDEPGTVSNGDFPAVVAGPGVDDDDFIDQAGNRLQTATEVLFLVADNQRS